MEIPRDLASSTHSDGTSVATQSSEDEGRSLMERSSSGDSVDSIDSSDYSKNKKSKISTFLRKPRSVCYTCSSCFKPYTYTVFDNPWYSIVKHNCPICEQSQIPSLDISTPFNAIELDPSFAVLINDASDIKSDCPVVDQSDDEAVNVSVTPVKLDSDDASKLLSLFIHAKTCAVQHDNVGHQMICSNAKSLISHIKTCSISHTFCSYPWCQPMKYLLLHLLNCNNQSTDPSICPVCSDWNANNNFKEIVKIFSNVFCCKLHCDEDLYVALSERQVIE